MDSRGPTNPPPFHHQQPHHHQHHHQQQQQQQQQQHQQQHHQQHHHQQNHQQNHQHHQQQHHHQPPPPPPGMMVHHHHTNSSYPTSAPPTTNMPNSSNPQMITPSSSSPMLQNNNNSNNRFPFNSSVVTNTLTPPKPSLEPLNSPYSGDGSSGLRPSGFAIDPNSSQKKKRGRPRKYSPDGGGSNIALGLAPTPISSSVVGSGGGDGGGGGGEQGDYGGTANSCDHSSKRNRGRPPSSSKKQLDALGNCGVGFTPHVVLVNAGEDIASKIMAFSKDGPRTVCVLSANGSVCNVSLRQPAMSGGIVKYEGRYEIISLSGSFLFSENSGGQVRTGGLSVSLAGSDGQVLGGGVAGMLVAASPVQIIVGSFIADGKKSKYMPSVPHSHMLSFAAPPLQAAESPPSQEVSSEGSEENGSNHIDRNMGSYNNSNHPIHNTTQMYAPMGWPNSGSKVFPN